MAAPDGPAVGSRWRRKPPGREVVEVRRRWVYTDGIDTVRAHPVRGGKVLITTVSWLLENYDEETP